MSKFTIKKLIGLSKKTNCFKNLFKYKNLNGEKFQLFFIKELKICVIVGIEEYLWGLKTEAGPKSKSKKLFN